MQIVNSKATVVFGVIFKILLLSFDCPWCTAKLGRPKRLVSYLMVEKLWAWEWTNHWLVQGFPGGSVVKNPPANAGDTEDVGSIPGLRRSPGGGNGKPHCIFGCKIPWPEEPGRLPSVGSQRVGHNWVRIHAPRSHLELTSHSKLSAPHLRESKMGHGKKQFPMVSAFNHLD